MVRPVVTEIGCFDNYSDAAPRAKTTRGNCITTFSLHVSQCITFHHNLFLTETLIAKASLKSFYSRLGFKVIKVFATSPNFENYCKKFHFKSVKSEALPIGLQYYPTIL